ncbi:MAG TPA: sugar ABC transporter substrate-binding protein [bacterium]|nr:sugar ABC transporter substrate-binding protein [bacterium]
MTRWSWLDRRLVGACLALVCFVMALSPALGAPQVISTVEPGSTSDTWVVWDKLSCSYKPASTHPVKWVAVLRQPLRPMRIGFGEQGEGQPLLDAFNNGMKAVTQKLGIPLLIGNYALPSTTEPVTQAQAIELRGPSVVISFNVLTAVMQAVNGIYARGCTPVIQVTAPAPNTVVFGASNSDVGKAEGQYLAAYVKQHNWAANTVTVLGLQDPGLGESIGLRISDCQAAVQAALPGVRVDNLPSVAPSTADAQTKTTDWLTAHPNDHHVLVCTIADIFAIGATNAFQGANRTADGVVMGAGGGSDATPVIKAGGAFVGTVDFGWGGYANYLVPLAMDIFEDKPVPTEIHQQLHVLDKSNIP